MPGVSAEPSRAPRRSTSLHWTRVKSVPTSVLPGNRTFESFAEPKSTSRSTQSSKVTSVSLQSRKLTESSLQPRNRTRLPTQAKAWTPANTHPLNQTSVSDDSARSTATSRVSLNHTSDSLARRSRPPSNPVPPVNAHSVNRAPPASASANDDPENSTRAESPSTSRPR